MSGDPRTATLYQRHQLRRGVALPRGVRSVGRGSRWGNPTRMKGHGGTATRSQAYGAYLNKIERDWRRIRKTRGRWLEIEPLMDATGLACWCQPNDLCHADILIWHVAEYVLDAIYRAHVFPTQDDADPPDALRVAMCEWDATTPMTLLRNMGVIL